VFKKKTLAKPEQALTIRQMLILLGIAALYFIITALPAPAGLPPQGQKAIALMVCVVLTWATQVVPILISSTFFVFLSAAIGLFEKDVDAVKAFAGPTVFFMLASVLMALALDHCGLCNRLTLKISVWSRGNAKLLILFLIAGSALLSSALSNVSTFVAFLPIVLLLCKRNNCEKGKSNFAKASLIGIIFGSMMGGMGTPAGSPINIMALELLEKNTGITMGFAEWTLLGMPIVLVSIPLLWLILIAVFPPEFKTLTGMENVKDELAAIKKLNPQEIKFLAVTAVMVAVWFTDKFHGLSTTTTAIIFTTLYFLPGLKLLEPKHVTKKVDWTVIIMTGASICLGTAMLSSGASAWLAQIALAPFAAWPPVLLVVVVAVFCVLLHILIPSCPACVAVLIPTLTAFAEASNIPVMLLFFPVAFTVQQCWLLPFDPLPMIIYPEKHFSIKDFAKAGVLGHAAVVALVVAFVMLLCRPLGYF